jgi:hypothetical protein
MFTELSQCSLLGQYIVMVSLVALLMFVFADFKFREVPDDLEDNYDKEEKEEEEAEVEYDPNKVRPITAPQ